MKLYTSLILTIFTICCKGQSKNFMGVWVATAEYRVENIRVLEIQEDFEIVPPLNMVSQIDSIARKETSKLDSLKQITHTSEFIASEIDTHFYPVHFLLELKEDGSALFKKLGEAEEETRWFPTEANNEIKIELEDTLLLRLDSSKHLSLVFYENDSLQKKILFEPLSKSKVKNAQIGQMLQTYAWNLSKTEEPNELTSTFQFQNDSLSIWFLNTDTATYITPGKWIIDEFSGHFFLFIQPNYIPFYLHLTDVVIGAKPKLLADVHALQGSAFPTKPPKQVNYVLTGAKLPSSEKHSSISKELMATWEAIDCPFPVDPMHFNQKISSYFLSYVFEENGKVKMKFGGEIKDDYGNEDIDKDKTMDWFVSKGGNLVVFGQPNSDARIAFFKILDSNTIEVHRKMKSLKGHFVKDMIFRMQRLGK